MTATISRPAMPRSTPMVAPPGGTKDTQQATCTPSPILPAPAGADSRPASVPPLPIEEAPGGPELADRQGSRVTQLRVAVGSDGEQGQAANQSTLSTLTSLLDPALCLAADVLDDLERVRTANENRLRQLTRSVEDSDGAMRGFGLDESHPDVARLAAMVETLKKVEHDATLQLQRQMRRHPLYAWTKTAKGVGDKQVARLLAAIGDPYIRPELVREDGTVVPEGPRTVSALWAYCGLHVVPAINGDGGDPGQIVYDTHTDHAGVAPKRQRGQRTNWSTKAKTRAYLIATSCLKQLVKPCVGDEHVDDCACSTYRVVYDRRRAHTAVTRPDWTDGHSHNDALRVVSKAILRDLWREAKRIHEDQPAP